MRKKVLDIQENSQNETLKIEGKKSKTPLYKKAQKLIKKKNELFKKISPVNEVNDIPPEKKGNYLYLKGKTFTPPKHLGNLLKIFSLGLILILIVNSINAYTTGLRLQRDISDQAQEGFSFLVDAGKSATKIQFNSALETFAKARQNFEQAENRLWFISTDKTFYANSSDETRALTALLEGGEHFAKAGSFFVTALEHYNKIPLYFVSKNSPDKSLDPSITEALKKGLDQTELAIEEISEASEKISKINEKALPSEIRTRIIFAKQKISELSKFLNQTSQHFPALLKLLGDRYPHRYLILLQNNNEIRPSGGFVGSYIIMDINDGYIEKIETHDSYDLDGRFGGYIDPPDEYKNFTNNLRFRDSNYSSDFKLSAQKARWTMQKEGGPSVDTVIAINQGLLRDMLEITGPVQVGQFGKLDSSNYNLLLSYVIEGKVWGEGNPKHILKVFVPAFKEAILKEENLAKVTSKLYKAIQQKHIMMYSADSDIQELFENFGLSGRSYQPQENEDFISVINFSVSGNKSDQFIQEEILHDTYIEENGAIINEITISKKHLWNSQIYRDWLNTVKAYGFNDIPEHLLSILGKGDNRVWMYVYVPAGSILLEASGQDVETRYSKELDKTYFHFNLLTKSGESSKIKIKYRLPFTLNLKPAQSYRLYAEKQPGSRGSLLTKTVTIDPKLQNLGTFPPEAKVDESGQVIYATNLVYDRYFSAIYGK